MVGKVIFCLEGDKPNGGQKNFRAILSEEIMLKISAFFI